MAEIHHLENRHDDIATRCYASEAYAVMRCPSVCLCPSVTFVNSVKPNNRIFKIFSPSGSYTLLVFAHQTPRQYSDGNPLPKEGALNAGDVGKTSDSRPVYGFIACCQRCDCQFLLTRRASGPWKVDTYR